MAPFVPDGAARREASASRGLRQMLDVLEHGEVDGVDHRVRPHLPVRVRCHIELVPRASLEPRPTARQWYQAKLSGNGAKGSVEVRGMNVAIRAPFAHRI